MSATWGRHFKVTIFGQSHGAAIGAVIDGVPAGLEIDEARIACDLARRAPGYAAGSTKRREPDRVNILSGVYNGRATGGPICGVIENTDTRSADYESLCLKPRPGHADYTGYVKYKGFNDPRGGGGFSGRLTAPFTFAGAIARLLLEKRGVTVGSHILSIHQVRDLPFDPVRVAAPLLLQLYQKSFPVIDDETGQRMRGAVAQAQQACDSLGGVIECAAVGLPVGWGDPFFNSLESDIAALLFSVPAVKAVEFGAGFGSCEMTGSVSNDPFCLKEGNVRTRTNNAGGIQGGISNGMPLIVRAGIKPTPSIARAQQTVDLTAMKETSIEIHGRHDACIVPRAAAVVEAAVLIALADAALGEGDTDEA